MGRPLRVLLIEARPDDAEGVARALQQGGLNPAWERVETADALRAALAAGPWDAVLSDDTLPEFGAGSALALVRAADADVPFLIVSGTVGEEAAVELMRAGANDYLLKHNLARLAPALARELREADNRRARHAAERDALWLAAVVAGADYAIISQTLDGEITTWNAGAERLYGYAAAEAVGRPASILLPPECADQLRSARERVGRGESVPAFDTVRRHKDGRPLDVSVSFSPVRDAAGRVIGMSGIGKDISARKKAERERGVLLAIIEYSPDFIGVADLDERVVFVNRAGQAMVGLDGDAAVRATRIGDYFDDAERARVERDVLPVLRAGGHLTGGAAFRHFRTGATIPTEWNVFAVPDPATGRPAFLACVAHDVSDRQRAEDALLLRDRAIRAATQGLIITEPGLPDNPIIFVSPGFERITGYRSAEALGRNCRFLQGKDTDPAAVTRLRRAVRAGAACALEILNYRKDGTPFWNELSISPVRDATGRLTHYVGVQADVTARRNLEEQLRQAQKMEAVGQLAGGVAHDFNNLLTIINGYSDLLLQTLLPGDPSRELVAEIHKAGERSAGLTRQLLAFSRQQVLAPRVLGLNAVVNDTDKMLRRLIGAGVQLTTDLAPDLWEVRADPGQIEQVLMNLAVNARDAMPAGGRLTVETRNVELGEAHVLAHPDARPGPHVLLSVADTGTGMPPEVLGRIFEPFFTTKEAGKGTGLGLATVYGIVKQSGGHVVVTSTVGVGTTFAVYLPRAEPAGAASVVRPGIPLPGAGAETILIVEDEDGVRALTHHVLTSYGYTVLQAGDGAEALRVVAEHAGPIHLLITDVVMPGMGGRDIAREVAARHPKVRVLFVSGYTDDAVLRHGVLGEGVNFLQKPFTPVALAFKVREVLAGAP